MLSITILISPFFFFLNDPPPPEIYPLPLPDALPIFRLRAHAQGTRRDDELPDGEAAVGHGPADLSQAAGRVCEVLQGDVRAPGRTRRRERSEEHTSELQSQSNLVCRLLLEKKKITKL